MQQKQRQPSHEIFSLLEVESSYLCFYNGQAFHNLEKKQDSFAQVFSRKKDGCGRFFFRSKKRHMAKLDS